MWRVIGRSHPTPEGEGAYEIEEVETRRFVGFFDLEEEYLPLVLAAPDLLDKVGRLERELADARTEATAYRQALQEIKDEQGRVCGQFEFCDHVACTSSYASWVIADRTLRLTGPGRDLLERIRKLERVVKAARDAERAWEENGTKFVDGCDLIPGAEWDNLRLSLRDVEVSDAIP